MAKVPALPGQDVIDGLAGVLDYYLWNGIAVVRKWPTWRQGPPGVEQGRAAAKFGYINQMAREISPDIIDAYKYLASGTSFTWKDYMNNLYISASTFSEGL
jgi:hypothetical protein